MSPKIKSACRFFYKSTGKARDLFLKEFVELFKVIATFLSIAITSIAVLAVFIALWQFIKNEGKFL